MIFFNYYILHELYNNINSKRNVFRGDSNSNSLNNDIKNNLSINLIISNYEKEYKHNPKAKRPTTLIKHFFNPVITKCLIRV